MVVKRCLVACCFVFACTRAYEDVPPGPEQGGADGEGGSAAGGDAGAPGSGGEGLGGLGGVEDWVITEDGYFYNPDFFRGNDEQGDRIDLTVCPNGQVLVGLDVYLHEISLTVENYPLTPDVPLALVMKCSTMDATGLVGSTKTNVTIGDIHAADLLGPTTMDCPDGSIVTTLRAGVDVLAPPRWVSAFGIECADGVGWRNPEASQLTNYAKQVGFSLVGTEHFADTCPKFFAVNGLSARIGKRIEQISGSCWATPEAWGLIRGIYGDRLPPTTPSN